jgi:hypothetical protein
MSLTKCHLFQMAQHFSLYTFVVYPMQSNVPKKQLMQYLQNVNIMN